MPAHKITVTKTEMVALAWAKEQAQMFLDAALTDATSTKTTLTFRKNLAKAFDSLINKALTPHSEPEGSTLQEAEAILRTSPKYARFVGGNAGWYVKRMREKRIDADQLRKVAAWCDRAPWLAGFDLGLLLNKWESWLSRATMAALTPSPASGAPAGFED